MEHVHLVGIGGAGMSAIATVLLERGNVVSGSDSQVSNFTCSLASVGAEVFIGHRAPQITGADVVLVSSAIPDSNPEIQAALAAGIPVVRRHDFIGSLMEGSLGVAVAGTHGKTTTTALLAYVLYRSGLDPSFIVGGLINDLGINARHGAGKPFVVEADEYDRMFLGLNPTVAVITNVEYDHPDCYVTAEDMIDAFQKFAELLPNDGVLIVAEDDPVSRLIGESAHARGVDVVTYSLADDADWQAARIKTNSVGGCDFEVFRGGRQALRLVRTRLAGRHNVGNTLAVLAASEYLGLHINETVELVYEFSGVGRRFDVKGEINGITIVDDYAHHPTEIRAALSSARLHYPGRAIWALFQPHTFSRTLLMLSNFAASLADADHVLVTDIFAARENDDGTVSSNDIVQLMEHPDAKYIPDLNDALQILSVQLQPSDVLITMGAGDIHTVADGVLKSLEKQSRIEAPA